MQGLTTGSIVHFDRTGPGTDSECLAAIITHEWSGDGMVNLYVFPDGVNEIGGVRTSIPFATGSLASWPSWHWPERV